MEYLLKRKQDKRKDFLDSITYLSEEDIKNDVPTPETLKRLSPLLNEYNPMTYALLLDNEKVKNEDKEYYKLVLERLLQREKTIVDETLKRFNNQDAKNIVYDV